MRKNLLLIEDNRTQQDYYAQVLENEGYSVTRADTAAQALDLFATLAPDVVALDLVLPDRDGLELMQDCHAMSPDVQFVVVTAHGTIQTAVEAMRHGAFEFLPKPVDDKHLVRAVARALAARGTPTFHVLEGGAGGTKPAQPPQSDPMRAVPLDGFVGYAPVMHELYRQIRAVSNSGVPIFLTGPMGSGRKLAAKAIHTLAFAHVANAPFCAFSASVLSPEAQMEALQGHGNTPDLITRAQGGTAYIEEPCTLCDAAQAALMARLQHLDSQPDTWGKVQLVTSTSRDPFAEVRAGHLREDLFHRLYVAPVRVPSLAERGEDVVAIANATIRTAETRTQRAFVGLDPQVARFFRTYDWPGNVKQLVNVVRSTVLLYDGPLITMDMLPMELTKSREANDSTPPLDALVGRTLAEVEEIIIEETIRAQKGSVPRAARVLDVSPSTLYRKREAWAKRGAS